MRLYTQYTPYYKRLLKLALPVIVAQAGQLTTQFADTAMVGQYGGEDPCPWRRCRWAARYSCSYTSLHLLAMTH